MKRREISNTDDMIDVRDVIARVEELENAVDEESEENDEEEVKELALLRELLDDLKGYGGDEKWRGAWYPVSLIHENYFTEAMQQLCEDIGDMPRGFPNYMVIDWEATAKNLQVDYSSVEFDGETYWYR